MDPSNERHRLAKRHLDDERLPANRPPPAQRTFAGLVATIAIAVALLALMWPNNAALERQATSAMSEPC